MHKSGRLASNLYRKPTVGNTLLRSNSAHPAPLKCSIPFGQFLHLRRICSNQIDFQANTDLLRNCLRQMGYSKSLLKKEYHNALTLKLLYHTKSTSTDEAVRCILMHSQQSDQNFTTVPVLVNRRYDHEAICI